MRLSHESITYLHAADYKFVWHLSAYVTSRVPVRKTSSCTSRGRGIKPLWRRFQTRAQPEDSPTCLWANLMLSLLEMVGNTLDIVYSWFFERAPADSFYAAILLTLGLGYLISKAMFTTSLSKARQNQRC